MPKYLRSIVIGVVTFLAATTGFLLSVLAWASTGFMSHFLGFIPVEPIASHLVLHEDASKLREHSPRRRLQPSRLSSDASNFSRRRLSRTTSVDTKVVNIGELSHPEREAYRPLLNSPPVLSESPLDDTVEDAPSFSSSELTRVHVDVENETDPSSQFQNIENEAAQDVTIPSLPRSPKRLSLHLPGFKCAKTARASRSDSTPLPSTVASRPVIQFPHDAILSENTPVQRSKSLSSSCLGKFKSKREATKLKKKKIGVSKASPVPVPRTEPYGPPYNFPPPTSPVPRDYFRSVRRVSNQYRSDSMPSPPMALTELRQPTTAPVNVF